MRWRGSRQSSNVEDRRGRSGRRSRGAFPMPRGRAGKPAGIGCFGILLIVAFSVITGTDPTQLLTMLAGGGAGGPSAGGGLPMEAPSAPAGGPIQDELGQFASTVLASTEDIWRQTFPELGAQYRDPTLVLFTNAADSACGYNSSAVGPFYCPADQQIYIDLSFFNELERRFGAPGDFAQAYVIAHEVGHHIQNLLGISTDVRRQQARMGKEQANQLSVRLELQADCLAGFWARRAHDTTPIQLEPGDVEEGMRAAAAIGDDNIQRQSQGYVVPESWTHGSSEQRMRWLREGLQSTDIRTACDTFDR